MLKQSPRRNQKTQGFIFMYGFQMLLSLAISIWLLYQVKQFYDKAYTESSSKLPKTLQSGGDIILNLGRKHMHIGRHGKLGEGIKEGDNIPKDSSTSQERAEDEEEPEDVEDLIDEEDKDDEEVSEELETEEKDNESSKELERHDEDEDEGRRAELFLAAKAEII